MSAEEVDDHPRVQVSSKDVRRANKDQFVRLIGGGIVAVSIIIIASMFFLIEESKNVQTMKYKAGMRKPLQSYITFLDALDVEFASLLPNAASSSASASLSSATDASLSVFAHNVHLSPADLTAMKQQLVLMRTVTADPTTQIGDQFLAYLSVLNDASPAMVHLLFEYISTWMRGNIKIVYDSSVAEAFDTAASFLMYLNSIHQPGDSLTSSESTFLLDRVGELHMTLTLAKTTINKGTSAQTNSSLTMWNKLLDQVETLLLHVFEFNATGAVGNIMPQFTQADNTSLNNMINYLSSETSLKSGTALPQITRVIYVAVNCVLLALATILNTWVVWRYWRHVRVARKLLYIFDSESVHHFLHVRYMPLLRQLRPIVLPPQAQNEVEREFLISARLLDRVRVMMPQLLFVRPAPSGVNTLMARRMNSSATAAADTSVTSVSALMRRSSSTNSNNVTSDRNNPEHSSNGNNKNSMNANLRRSSVGGSVVNMAGAVSSSLLGRDIKAGANAVSPAGGGAVSYGRASFRGSEAGLNSPNAGTRGYTGLSRRSDAFGAQWMSGTTAVGGYTGNGQSVSQSAAYATWSNFAESSDNAGCLDDSQSSSVWNILQEKARLQQGTWTCPYIVVLDIGLTSYTTALSIVAEADKLAAISGGGSSSSTMHIKSHRKKITGKPDDVYGVMQHLATNYVPCGNELAHSPVAGTAATDAGGNADSPIADYHLLPRHLQLLCSAYRVIVDEVGRAGGVVLGFSSGVHIQAVWNIADRQPSQQQRRCGEGGMVGNVSFSPAVVALQTALHLRERLLRSVVGLTDVSMMLVSGGGILANMPLGTRLTSTLISSMFLCLPKLQVIARSLHCALLMDTNTYQALPGSARSGCRPLVILRTSDMVESATMVVYCLEEIANITDDQREMYSSGFFLYQNNIITEALVQFRRYLRLYPHDRVAHWLLRRVLLPRQYISHSRSQVS